MTRQSRLTQAEAATVLDGVSTIPVHRGASPIQVVGLCGVDLEGARVQIDPPQGSGATLLLFLSVSCQGCQDLYDALGQPRQFGIADDAEIIVVLNSLSKEEREVVRAMGYEITCIVSPSAWVDYKVTGPPFFSYLEPGYATVATEGVAWGTESIATAVQRVRDGAPTVATPRLESPRVEG